MWNGQNTAVAKDVSIYLEYAVTLPCDGDSNLAQSVMGGVRVRF